MSLPHPGDRPGGIPDVGRSAAEGRRCLRAHALDDRPRAARSQATVQRPLIASTALPLPDGYGPRDRRGMRSSGPRRVGPEGRWACRLRVRPAAPRPRRRSRAAWPRPRAAEATGLSAKVAKPQSGVSSTRSGPKRSMARRARATISVDGLDAVVLLVHDADAEADRRAAGRAGPPARRRAACTARGRACRPGGARRAAAAVGSRRPARRPRRASSCRGRRAARAARAAGRR